MSKQNGKLLRKPSKCHICNKFHTEKDIKVRDHCHITGEYRGSAHQICCINCRLTKKITCNII